MSDDELTLGDLLLIAEAVLGIPAEQVARITDVPLAESALAAPFASYGGTTFYPHPVQRAAICCCRVIRNHPLPDGNKRLGYECMREMLYRSNVEWPRPAEDADVIVAMVEGLAGKTVSEQRFVAWAQERTGRS